MKKLVLLCAAFGAVHSDASAWSIKLNSSDCQADWVTSQGMLRFVVRPYYKNQRGEAGLYPVDKPVMIFQPFRDTSLWSTGPDEDEDIQIRVFPDDGAGFVKEDHVTIDRYGDQVTEVEWLDPPVERMRVWGTAKETKEDAGVRLPEVRLIFKWETDSSDDFDTEHFLDIPLWRMSNVVNKLERCVCQKHRNLEEAKCWEDSGAG